VHDSQNGQAPDNMRGITGLLGLPAIEYIVRCDSSREKTFREYNGKFCSVDQLSDPVWLTLGIASSTKQSYGRRLTNPNPSNS
jgi:hypothetical protein